MVQSNSGHEPEVVASSGYENLRNAYQHLRNADELRSPRSHDVNGLRTPIRSPRPRDANGIRSPRPHNACGSPSSPPTSYFHHALHHTGNLDKNASEALVSHQSAAPQGQKN